MARELTWAFLLFALLIASAGIGSYLRIRLPAPHRSGETMDFLRIVTALLVTFTALVLSLLLASVRSAYDTAYRDRAHYAASLAELDQCMRDYGPELAATRTKLHGYTAAVIVSTWPGEPLPTGVAVPDTEDIPRLGEAPTLATLMNDIGLQIAALDPSDAVHKALAARCTGDFANVMTARWTVIEDVHGSLSPPFAGVLMFWLMLVFLSFGLQAPRNLLAGVVIAIAIVSVTSVMFVILDLDLPYGGLFGIPSHSMRLALADMLR
jgi:hypothetical protein